MKNKNSIPCTFRLMTTSSMLTVLIAIAGCNKASEVAGNALDAGRSVATGKGGSVVSGSAGPAGLMVRQSNW